ncbi:hypothetical protein L1987_21335 [Smallanthus sonchifolius]|uniref:Uncharacterized protein n=1 Tax=Smallanthus sonchifolius TaxID=185202 RepID=A0ACB9IUM0_9ASTR|nr:hypothetical protein L1987_21335 [Smallanthus sonchifolius]
MTVKRLRLEDDMANCLMLLSRVGESGPASEPDRLFRCKTCNKPFQSFQALGGHSASHKRLKLNDVSPRKPKTHECSVCGQEFAIGQALGGHMRRHRDEGTGKGVSMVVKKQSGTTDLDLDLNLTLWPIVT